MKIIPLNYNNYKRQDKIKTNNKFVSNVVTPEYNKPKMINSNYFQPNFKGLGFEKNVIRKVIGKLYQGLGSYTEAKGGLFIDMRKIGYTKLSSELLNIVTATDAEVAAHRFSLALVETYAKNPDDPSQFATHWVARYNPDNRHSPLAVSHAVGDFDTMEGIFAKNIEILRNPSLCKSLDIPITDKNGNLCIDALVFDTETTGTDTKKDKIIQIGARILKGGKVVNTEKGFYNKLINPEIPIPEGASAVNGITDEMVQNAPTIESVMNEFLEKYMNKSSGIIVAWNGVKFDIPLLNRTIRELRDINNISKGHKKDKIIAEKQLYKILDPQILIMRIHPFLGASKKLANQYHWMFCKPMTGAHDALADVNGTIPMLKYALYWLSEHRTNKSVPLTLRQVLLFQNGASKVPEIEPLLHHTKYFNSKVDFKMSYRAENLDLINYFDKYHLDEKMVDSLANEIGMDNVQKLKQEGIIGTIVDDKYKGHPLQAAETQKINKTNKKRSLSYIMRENFKKVLGFAELEEFNRKSKAEIEDLIVEKSKVYLDGNSKTLWLKNVNADDISIGNDLPDDNITRKVMKEMQEDGI